jgi:hypothetical protein
LKARKGQVAHHDHDRVIGRHREASEMTGHGRVAQWCSVVVEEVDDALRATQTWRDAAVRLGECAMAWRSSVQEELADGEAARVNWSFKLRR